MKLIAALALLAIFITSTTSAPTPVPAEELQQSASSQEFEQIPQSQAVQLEALQREPIFTKGRLLKKPSQKPKASNRVKVGTGKSEPRPWRAATATASSRAASIGMGPPRAKAASDLGSTSVSMKAAASGTRPLAVYDAQTSQGPYEGVTGILSATGSSGDDIDRDDDVDR